MQTLHELWWFLISRRTGTSPGFIHEEALGGYLGGYLSSRGLSLAARAKANGYPGQLVVRVTWDTDGSGKPCKRQYYCGGYDASAACALLSIPVHIVFEWEVSRIKLSVRKSFDFWCFSSSNNFCLQRIAKMGILQRFVKNDAMKSDPPEIYGWRVFALATAGISSCESQKNKQNTWLKQLSL